MHVVQASITFTQKLIRGVVMGNTLNMLEKLRRKTEMALHCSVSVKSRNAMPVF